MRRTRTALAFSALACASCSLFVSLDDLQTTSEPDLGTDASPSDVVVVEGNDAALDAGSALDADAHVTVPYCDVTAKDADYCNDFDAVDAATATWSFVNADDGFFTLESTDVVSAPTAVAVSAKPGVVDPQQRLGYEHTYTGGAPNVFHVHFAVRFTSADDTKNVHFLGTSFDRSTGSSYTLELTRKGTAGTLVEGVPVDGGTNYVSHDLGSAFASSDWIDVDMNVDFKAKAVTITSNGGVVYDSPPLSGSSGHISATIGLAYYTGKVPDSTAIQFDDFAVFHQ